MCFSKPRGVVRASQGGNGGNFSPDISEIDFNGLLYSDGDLLIDVENVDVDYTLSYGGAVNLAQVIVGGDLICSARGDYSWVRFGGSESNNIQGTLYLGSDHGYFIFSQASNTVAAAWIVVQSPARINLDAPGNIGTGSTVIVERGAELDLAGAYNPLMGTLLLRNGAADTTSSIFNAGPTVPEFGPGAAILVGGDNDQVSPVIKGSIHLDGAQISVGGIGKTVLDIPGTVQGTGFTKTGTGTLMLDGNNNFTGPVTVAEGTLQPAKSAALNFSGPQQALHLIGGTLLDQNLDIQGVPLYVDSADSELVAYTPCTWEGAVILNATLSVSPVDLHATNAPIVFSGAISGPGGLNLQNAFFGAGAVRLSGASANTFTGPITDNCQLLELDKLANVPAFGGPLVAGGPGGVALGEVRWLNSGQGALPSVTLYSNCLVNLNNFSENFGAITFNGGDIETGSGQLSLFEPVTVNPAGVTAIIGGNVSIPSIDSAIFNVGAGGIDPDLLIRAGVSGVTPVVIKTGPGILRLAGNNNLAANIAVKQGTLEVGNAQALGNSTNLVSVDTGATLQAEPGVIAANPISLAGGLDVPSGRSVVLEGAIALQGATTINVQGNLLIDSAINGNGPLTKAGGGTLTFGGIAPNNYVGDTQVSGGTLVLNKPTGVNAVPGRLIIGNQFRSGGATTVLQQSSFSIVGSVTVNGGRVQTGAGVVYIPVGGDVEVVPSTTGTSTITGNLGLDPGPHNFIVGARSAAVAGPECSISANITQTSTAAQLIKSGAGTLVLTGANTYTGSTIVSNGTLEIDGLQPASAVQVLGGTLQGHGLVGPLEMDDPNAVLYPIGLPSTFLCSDFNGGATPAGTLKVYLAGTQAGTGYSQLQAEGALTLTDLNLDASLDFYSAPGDQFKIIANDGSLGGGPQPVVGTFNGLPEGSIFPVSGELFQISYVGGSGHDVVLTHVSAATQANVANWIDTAGGDWNTAANWDPQAVPNGGNAVVAITTPSVISNNASAALSQLLYNSPLCTITGSGSLTLGGLFDWQAGAFSGSGSLMANRGLHLDPPASGNLSLTGESLINSGAATWSGSSAIILGGGAVLSNTASGTFDCAADGTIQNGPGTNLLANAGLFRKINGTGTTTIQVPFDNSGNVQVQSGTLDLAGGGSSSGNYEVSSGASLNFSAGTNNATPSSTITGPGDFHVLGGIANLFGSITTLGAHLFSGGIVNLGGNYNPANNDLSIGASTVNFDGANPVSAASLTVGGYGSLGGSNLVTVNGPMTWNSRFTITGSNSVIANGGLTIGPGGALLGRTLLNTASGVWTNNGIGTLVLGGGAVFSNAPGATFDCLGNDIVGQTTGGGTVANAGLFRTIGAPATNLFEVPFNNRGTLEVQSGMLSLAGGGTNTGLINVFANATLSLGGAFSLAPGASITGPGQLLVTSTTAAANLAGTVSLSGSNTFSGGVANLTGNYVCSGNALTIGAGTANFNSSNVIAPASLVIGADGTLGGSNLVTVNGPMTWHGAGAITGSNSVIANGGLTIGPGSVLLDGRTLLNMASGVWTNNGGVGTLALIHGAVLSNAPGATFDCVGNGVIEASTGGGLVANAGLFQTVGAPATTIIEAPFSNNAVVEVQSGTLSLAGGGSSISPSNSVAEIAVSSNATIDFHGGTFLLGSSAIIDGLGNLSVSGGTANLAGEVDLLGSHTFSGGVANLTGFYNCVSNALLISGGTANFNGSGVIAPASLVLGIGGTLGGSNLVTVNGPTTWHGAGTITGANSLTANGGLTIGPGGVSLAGRALVNLQVRPVDQRRQRQRRF